MSGGVSEREEVLDVFGAIGAGFEQQSDAFEKLLVATILQGRFIVGAAFDSIQNGAKLEDQAAGVEKFMREGTRRVGYGIKLGSHCGLSDKLVHGMYRGNVVPNRSNSFGLTNR